MHLTLHYVALPLRHPFGISRGTVAVQPSMIVQLTDKGHDGFGEVTENAFYGHDFASLTASLQCAAPLLSQYRDRAPAEVWDEIRIALHDDWFALSALDMAAHDLRGKRLNKPTWMDWGLRWQQLVPSSFTIGLDTLEVMQDKLRQRPGWPIYKIKLGTENDLEIVRALRTLTDATFRVDANGAWTVQQTIDYSHELATLGVEFIEQPLPIDASAEDKRLVFSGSTLPIIADEDCQQAPDVQRCRGLYHGVNVKICKCGGLTPALRMLRAAKQVGLRTMVGCMVESSIGISGAAQLLPLLDYADLDGAALLRDDPASGVRVHRGQVQLSPLPGCGGQLRLEVLDQLRAADRNGVVLCSERIQ